MLRIAPVSIAPGKVLLKLEGWLGGDHVDVLAEEGRRLRTEGRTVTVDLDELRGVDSRGMALLGCWARKGVELCGGSPFIRLLLERHGVL